jgi:hypothetical protein
MSDNTLFRPKAFPIREPLDKKRHHGRIVNPPRMNQLGGLDQLNEPHGHFKNDMNIHKPGGTTSGSKK